SVRFVKQFPRRARDDRTGQKQHIFPVLHPRSEAFSVNRFLTSAGYARRMPPVLPRTAAAALLLFACGAADAATVRSVEIHGLDDAMTENVRVSLSLVDAIGKDLRGRRLGYLVRTADDETREALEPFGYYSPQVTVERNRGEGGLDVVITVDPGEPVRVRDADIAIIGEGGRDRYLKQDLGEFQPDTGDV